MGSDPVAIKTFLALTYSTELSAAVTLSKVLAILISELYMILSKDPCPFK
jgi:hypothetical protein